MFAREVRWPAKRGSGIARAGLRTRKRWNRGGQERRSPRILEDGLRNGRWDAKRGRRVARVGERTGKRLSERGQSMGGPPEILVDGLTRADSGYVSWVRAQRG